MTLTPTPPRVAEGHTALKRCLGCSGAVGGCGGLRPPEKKNSGAGGRARAARSACASGMGVWGPRHRGYRQSQKRRKLVEQVFGWMKTGGGGRKLRFVGRERNRGWLELTAAA